MAGFGDLGKDGIDILIMKSNPRVLGTSAYYVL